MSSSRVRIITLVSGLGWHVRDLQRAAEAHDVELRPEPFPGLVARVAQLGPRATAGALALERADAILTRMMPPGSLEQVVFRMDVLQRLHAEGMPILNTPRAVEISVDKYLSLSLMERAGLAVPPTTACETARDALAAFEAMGGDVVVKPLFGSEGRGLVRVSDREIASRVFHALERIQAVIYLQKAIRHPGYDLRVFVLGGRVLASMRRYSPQGEWRTNVAVGGRPEACRIEARQEQLALAAAAAVGADLAGVDLIDDLDHDEPVVLEVNAVPGWRALAAATTTDVAGAIVAHLKGMRR